MSINISTYPLLNRFLRDRLWRNIQPQYEFSYIKNNEEHALVCEEVGDGANTVRLVDQYGSWNPDSENLIVRRQYEFMNYDDLFGDGGIACQDAAIGVAVVWSSRESKQRNAISIGRLKKGRGDISLDLEYDFGVAGLRGSLTLTTVLYIDEPGTVSNSGAFANTSGMLLGELDRLQIQIDGSGSTFPIYEVEEKDQPLWYVNCNWEDPTCDQFSEAVEININRAHKNYIYLDRTKSKYDPQLMLEVMSNALGIIITKLKEDPCWSDTVNGTGFQQGSVSEAVYYFMSTLEWDVSTPESTSVSIHKFFDGKDI